MGRICSKVRLDLCIKRLKNYRSRSMSINSWLITSWILKIGRLPLSTAILSKSFKRKRRKAISAKQQSILKKLMRKNNKTIMTNKRKNQEMNPKISRNLLKIKVQLSIMIHRIKNRIKLIVHWIINSWLHHKIQKILRLISNRLISLLFQMTYFSQP